eukprot:m.358083 g.358083  ORF g.358083 m.358083 type:complete len:72 (-) comp100538_c0_seq1:121-336(-)
MCQKILDKDNDVLHFTFNHERKGPSQSPTQSITVEIEFAQDVTTPNSKELTGHAGDLYISAALSFCSYTNR